ncbi:hypothetical protein BDN72DRAFT_209139 [Pluteus cervinus]|uniref:Uncharacterized protein n=1 Tax=Pluteus cervinus TaxID=181527 RepID=A0ACD3AHR7_9AGAR|nr:hypothetical protein BDN72DRAFT_209139 [Pluteus cervinus]
MPPIARSFRAGPHGLTPCNFWPGESLLLLNPHLLLVRYSMDGRNPEVIESTPQEIGLEIATLEERIRVLRSQLNARATVSRFPAEVLTEIFSWVQQFGGDISSWSFNASTLVRWINVTHVSRNWRQIALCSRKLWSIIPVRSVRYAIEAMKRSGSAPLVILTLMHIHKVARDDEELWQLILAASPRIRVLRLGGQSQLKDFNRPLPFLENLHFQGGKEVPPALLSTSLKHLSLDSCSFDWDHLGLDKLTTLKITNPRRKVSFDAFILLLTSMPQLASLEVGSIFAEPDSQAQNLTLCELIGSPLPVVTSDLPTLSFFKAHISPSPAYIQLLARLRFEPKFVLVLAFKQQKYNDRDVILVLQILNRAVRNSSRKIRGIKCFSGGITAKRTVSFSFFANSRLGSPFMTFWVELPMSNINYSRWLRELAPFPLDDVEVLSTDGINSKSGWTDNVFSGLSNLRRLQILAHGDVFLEYLIEDSRTAGLISFPALEELEIHDLHFSTTFKSTMPYCLGRREARYARLRELIFIGGKVTDAAVRKLEPRVDKVQRISLEESRNQRRLRR